jgi:predicted deacylase
MSGRRPRRCSRAVSRTAFRGSHDLEPAARRYDTDRLVADRQSAPGNARAVGGRHSTELGWAAMVTPETVGVAERGLDNLLKHFGMLDG